VIHIGFSNPSASETDRATRQRTMTPANAFEDRNQRSGLDFNSKAGAASQSSGTGGLSMLDLYAPAWKSEQAQKDANATRAEKLLPSVRHLAQSHGLDIDALEVINIVVRNAKIMGGEAVIFASDAARAVGIDTRKAEAVISDAVSRGLLEDRGGNRFRSKI
jgi:hypothetical protein